jgi:ABC-type lipoprotein release transport system permease subunit
VRLTRAMSRESQGAESSGAALLLFAIAMLAGWGPARRASLIQPMQALRHE